MTKSDIIPFKKPVAVLSFAGALLLYAGITAWVIRDSDVPLTQDVQISHKYIDSDLIELRAQIASEKEQHGENWIMKYNEFTINTSSARYLTGGIDYLLKAELPGDLDQRVDELVQAFVSRTNPIDGTSLNIVGIFRSDAESEYGFTPPNGMALVYREIIEGEHPSTRNSAIAGIILHELIHNEFDIYYTKEGKSYDDLTKIEQQAQESVALLYQLNFLAHTNPQIARWTPYNNYSDFFSGLGIEQNFDNPTPDFLNTIDNVTREQEQIIRQKLGLDLVEYKD